MAASSHKFPLLSTQQKSSNLQSGNECLHNFASTKTAYQSREQTLLQPETVFAETLTHNIQARFRLQHHQHSA